MMMVVMCFAGLSGASPLLTKGGDGLVLTGAREPNLGRQVRGGEGGYVDGVKVVVRLSRGCIRRVSPPDRKERRSGTGEHGERQPGRKVEGGGRVGEQGVDGWRGEQAGQGSGGNVAWVLGKLLHSWQERDSLVLAGTGEPNLGRQVRGGEGGHDDGV